uniref:RRM domain-containing protein n=1 Tax=Dunaliella tertiolecta TaxID=3047 RepID=A0A7S3VLL5_DUNTE|eukprot:CAMPEP_0202421396 /NCGR_PEP_ID=MMETSP1128-20130828/50314_1 /ASSEMBLY_ACC=CAM_ASM_000463 /TAXON_ID=3047 /ORGANISM="Dunaliella tertiolecta, Strain CCMP1320" /LENGTH=656 /DNA_ID=CAMNT_0049029411 /DNA_START=41 /DNA_END=2011 /DNA_ORIENTATION=+
MDPNPSSAAATGQRAQPGMQQGPELLVPVGGRSRDVGTEDAVRTIFITGFPQGVKERELHNLVRYLPGYEASQMSMRGDLALGFVLFSSHWHARQAQDAIAGTPFEVLLPASLAPTSATAAGPSQLIPPTRPTSTPTPPSHRSEGAEAGEPLAATGEPLAAAREPVAEAPADSAATAVPAAIAEGGQEGSKGHPAAEHLAAIQGANDVKVTGGAQKGSAMEKEEGGTSIFEEMAAGAPESGSAAAAAEVATTAAAATAAKLQSEAASGAAIPGDGVETTKPGGRQTPVTIRLRCELARKNLHIKESDPSIHRPHRPLLLLPHPPSPYGQAPFPVPTPLSASLQSPAPSPASANLQVPVPASSSTSLGLAGVKPPPLPTTRPRAPPPARAPSATAAAFAAPSAVTHTVPSDVAPAIGGPSDYSWGMAGADVRLMGPSGHPLGTFLHQHQPYPQQQEQQHYQQQQQEQSQPVPFTSPSTGAPRHSQSAPLPYGPPSPSSSSTATVPRGRGGMIGLGGTMGFLPVTNRGDNPPCNTLFVGNLSDTVSEVELCQLFSAQPGYRQMKLVRGPKQVSCFVEFDDLISATTVHQALQGAVLATSERGGMRIQFSKNPYGRRTPHVADPMPAMPPTPMGPFYSSPSWAAAPIMPPHHMPHMPPY